MPSVYEHRWRVTEEEIDGLGHVGNVEYVRWLQEAAIAHSAAQGWPTRRYHEVGAGWVVRSHQIEYLRPAYQDDEVLVRTWVASLRGIRSLRKYHILRPSDDAVLAVAQTEWVFISFDKRTPLRVPEEIRQAFEIVADFDSQTPTDDSN